MHKYIINVTIFIGVLLLAGCKDLHEDASQIDFNEAKPGVIMAALCKDEKTNKTTKKIKYLGFVTNFFIGKEWTSYMNEKPCGKQKMDMGSFDFGFFACKWNAQGDTREGKALSFSGELKDDETLLIGADKAWFGHKNWAWLELSAQAK